MRSVLLRICFGSLFLNLATASTALSQSKPDFPLPEYFGTYAVSNGKVVGLDSDIGSPDKTAVNLGIRNNAMAVCRNGAMVARDPVNVPLPVFGSDVQFLVFMEASGAASPMMVAKDMELFSVGFIRNVEFTGCPNTGMFRRGAENGWGENTQRLQLRTKPVAGQQQMVLTVPASRLAPGVYSLSFDPIANGSMFKKNYIFAIQPIAEAANKKCFDLSIPYNVSLFQNNGEMPSTLTACGSSPTPPAASTDSQSSSAPSGSQPSSTRGTGTSAAPTLNSPAEGAIFHNFPRHTTLSWQAVAGASGYSVEVDFSDGGGGWEKTEFVRGVTETTFSFDFVGKQRGRWRVCALDNSSPEGTCSEWRTFEYTI